MTLRPEIEALVQGALDGSLSPEDRQTLDQLMASDPSVRARAAELDQLAALLQSVRQVDAPPTFAADVLARIRASNDRVVEFSRPSKTARGSAMNKKIIWGLAAAAVLVLAVVGYVANPSVNQGTEATIGTAQRYQAPQIEAKDVAVGDTKTQELMQTATWDAILKDETLRTLLQDANFRAKLQDAELRQALADQELLKRLADTDLQTALRNPALAKALADENFRARLADANVMAALSRPAFQAALRDRGFAAALQHPAFAHALAIRGGCDEFGCGSNSPTIGGAVIR